MICAVRLAERCRPPASPLQLAYGPELAALIAAQAPELRFEDGDFVSLPVDPRECRSRACADSSERGSLGRSFEDLAADGVRARGRLPARRRSRCRPTARAPGPATSTCSTGSTTPIPRPGPSVGSAVSTGTTGRASRSAIGPTGEASARASSHHSYNHDADPVSDLGRLGAGPVSVDVREPGWGPASGFVWVSAGSHAGRVAGDDAYFRSVPAERLRLLPLDAELRSLSAPRLRDLATLAQAGLARPRVGSHLRGAGGRPRRPPRLSPAWKDCRKDPV